MGLTSCASETSDVTVGSGPSFTGAEGRRNEGPLSLKNCESYLEQFVA